ncbi:MAG: holo-[acyl-carrier-protein] synthase [Chloroflexi bacterium RBG_16_50_9]|nr:MAG: holo-[acyl-carrier-protein] synthase [Chloroflexi bacterium RBG_16_50_9]
MKHYIGTDIIEIARIRQAADLWGERFLRRIYTEQELNLYSKNPPSLAARFASKEAVMKLLGTGGIGWRDIETLASSSGKPKLKLYGRAQHIANNLGIKEIDVSLSHCRDYAIAAAIGST